MNCDSVVDDDDEDNDDDDDDDGGGGGITNYLLQYKGMCKPSNTTEILSTLLLAACFGFSGKPSSDN